MKDIIIEVDDYIKEVTISKAVRPKYKVNKDGEKVISNPRSANKPRMRKINGQDLWSGIDHHLRSKIAKEIKVYFYEIFKKKKLKFINKKHYPLSIGLTFYGPLGDYDLDNHVSWYRKCIQDALCGNVEFIKVTKGKRNSYIPDRENYPALMEDDNVKCIQSIPCDFVESDSSKLIITIKSLKNVHSKRKTKTSDS